MPDHCRIDPLRFEAAVRDPSPFVVVLGGRRSGKTTLIKQRLRREYGSHNIVLINHSAMRFDFSDVRDYIERFYTNDMDLRDQIGAGKNLYIDEFSLINGLMQRRHFLYGGWDTITMVSSLDSGVSMIDLSSLDQFSIHDWYDDTNRGPYEDELPNSMKFRLMAGT